MNEQQLKNKLYAHKYNLARLKILEERLKTYWTEGMKGLTYDKDKLCESYKFNSATENTAESNMEEYDKLIKEHCIVEKDVKEIQITLDYLLEPYKTIVIMRYINRDNWVNIAHVIHKGYDYTKDDLHKKAIGKMLEVLK